MRKKYLMVKMMFEMWVVSYIKTPIDLLYFYLFVKVQQSVKAGSFVLPAFLLYLQISDLKNPHNVVTIRAVQLQQNLSIIFENVSEIFKHQH